MTVTPSSDNPDITFRPTADPHVHQCGKLGAPHVPDPTADREAAAADELTHRRNGEWRVNRDGHPISYGQDSDSGGENTTRPR